MLEGSRVALVHDFLVDVRGAERVFLTLCDLFPQADVFTAVYDEQGTEGRFAGREIRTSYLQKLHPTARSFRALLPLYPGAMEALDLSGYDLVLSSSSAWAHGVIPDPGAVHVCYCHNPFRYAWNARSETLSARSALLARGAGPGLPALAPVGLHRRPARRRATSRTRRPRRSASRATSAASRPCCIRPWRSAASRPARRARSTSSSPS